MKTIKELLQLTLDEGNKLHLIPKAKRKFCFTGLCGFVLFYLYHQDLNLINDKEFNLLYQFIGDNIPKTPTSDKFYGTIDYNIGYYWPSGKWAPRKKWLEDQIKSL
jgi:hypothetical protein